MDPGIYSWGREKQLPEDVIHVLDLQGFNCVSELYQLDEQDIEQFFKIPGILSDEDCTALKSALASIPASLFPADSSVWQSASASRYDDPSTSRLPQDMGGSGDENHGAGDQCEDMSDPYQVPYNQDNDDILADYDPEEFEHIHASLATAVVQEEAPREFCRPVQRSPAAAVATTWGDDVACGGDSIDLGETVRLLLAGKTGNGKSTTGNTILGQELFNTAPDFGSVTAECERQVAFNRNKRLEIMDSPGLYDTSKTHEEICTIIVQAVAGMHPGPHAILYVIKVGRYTPEEHKAYGRLKALFDETITRHIILLFTYGDQLEREGKTLEDLMRSPSTPDSLREVFEECGHRYVLFNNVAEDKGPQVDSLLQQVKMLVASNGGQPYICPKYSKIGEGLEEEVNKRMEVFEKKDLQRQKYVQELERQTKDAEMAAELTRQEFEEQEDRRQQEMQKGERRRRQLEEELRQKLEKQTDNSEKQRRELEQLKKERKRMEAEHAKARKEHERQRRKEQKRLDEKYQAFEREQKRMREEERKREKKRAEEMERLKSRVVEKKEPGFLSKAVDFVANPIKKFFGIFGL